MIIVPGVGERGGGGKINDQRFNIWSKVEHMIKVTVSLNDAREASIYIWYIYMYIKPYIILNLWYKCK